MQKPQRQRQRLRSPVVTSVKPCALGWSPLLEPNPNRALNLPKGIRDRGQPELRAAGNRVDAGVGDAVQDIGRVDPPVDREPVAPWKRAADAGVERKLPRSCD